jgi:fatty-acyl-CoA synthase
MDQRAGSLAQACVDAGLGPGSTVAICLFNCLEWMECYYGLLKVRLIPVGINYRYLDDELAFLLDDSDARAVIYHSSLADRVVRVASRLPGMRALVQVDDARDVQVPPNALSYEDIVTSVRPAPRMSRPPEDITMSYSGGTTGRPRGVVAPIGESVELSASQAGRIQTLGRYGSDPASVPADPVAHARQLWEQGGRPVALPAAPLMHTTANFFAGTTILHCGGAIVTLESRRFDPHELCATVGERGVTNIVIVGDAFAKPITRALEAGAPSGQPYDCSSVRTILSAGAMWTADVKGRIFEHLPEVLLIDNCGSSEGAWYGNSVTRKGDATSSSRFVPAPGVVTLDEAGNPLPAWSGIPGLLAAPTTMSGYHKDPDKTAERFQRIGGTLYAVPGDYGALNPDGSLSFIGRGSSVINTGGEKVFPEEVEEIIKTMEQVDDCIVLGLPDDDFGQAVSALVQLRPGASTTDGDIRQCVREHLASYKAPRRVVLVAQVPRLSNGKADYAEAKRLADRVST